MTATDVTLSVDGALPDAYGKTGDRPHRLATSATHAVGVGLRSVVEPGQPSATDPVLSVLVAEPDHDCAEQLAARLGLHRMRVIISLDGADTLLQAGRHRPDVVLLNPRLPLVEGWLVVKTLQQELSTPVIVGLGPDDPPEDGLRALEAGAAAVVPVPYRLNELAPILLASRLMRSAPGSAGVMTVGPLKLDGEGYQVTHHEESVHLSLREFQILALLMAQPEHTFTYEEVCRRVWGTTAARRSNTLSVNVKRLRDKLGDDPGNPQLIQTVRGVGYRLVTPGGHA